MDEMIEMNYDEHVKAHQRHVLITWLESAKSEKIKAVKDSVKIRSIKVIALTPDINMIAQPIISDELQQTINHRFDGIPTDVDVPSAVVVAEQTEQETQAIKQRFDGIRTNAAVPEKITVAPDVISVQLPGISLPPKPRLDISDIIECLIAEKTRIGRTESQ